MIVGSDDARRDANLGKSSLYLRHLHDQELEEARRLERLAREHRDRALNIAIALANISAVRREGLTP